MKTISIVVPCYNESGNLGLLYNRIKSVFEKLNYRYELIFVDNVSTDDSEAIYRELVAMDSQVKVIFMARNTGTSQASYFAGLCHASGDAVALLDADLQDPPELIVEFTKKWEEGYQVIYGVRTKRKEGLARRIGYKCFYILFRWLSYLDIPLNAGDFGMMDRRVVDIIKHLPEKDIFLRGLRAWVGFKQIGVEYDRPPRYSGTTTISFLDNFSWAKKAIVNFSYKPLEFISRLAMGAIFITMLLSFYYLYHLNNSPRGFMTLLMVMFIFNSIQLLALSVLAEYQIRMFTEVKNRPPYVVDRILTQQTVTVAPFPSVQEHRAKEFLR